MASVHVILYFIGDEYFTLCFVLYAMCDQSIWQFLQACPLRQVTSDHSPGSLSEIFIEIDIFFLKYHTHHIIIIIFFINNNISINLLRNICWVASKLF